MKLGMTQYNPVRPGMMGTMKGSKPDLSGGEDIR